MVKNVPANEGDKRRLGFDPWVGKIPWRRKWQFTPVFLPGESNGQRSLAGYSPESRKELNRSEHAHPHKLYYRKQYSLKNFVMQMEYIFCYLSAFKALIFPTDFMYILSSIFFSNFEIYHHPKIAF